MINLTVPQPYLLFVGENPFARYAKTAFGLVEWARERCVGEFATSDSAVTTGLPRMTLAEAKTRGARCLVIGVAPVGGAISSAWIPTLVEAMEVGMDLVSGMHTRLGSVPALAAAAARTGQRLFDVRDRRPD